MKNSSKPLAHYFETAKNIPPSISMPEVKMLINNPGNHINPEESSQTIPFFTLRKLTIINSGIAATILLFVAVGKDYLPEYIKKYTFEITTHQPNPQKDNKAELTAPGNKNKHQPDTIAKAKENKAEIETPIQNTKYIEYIPEEEKYSKFYNTVPANSSKDGILVKYLEADEKTLQNLGITSDETGIRYFYHVDKTDESLVSITVKSSRKQGFKPYEYFLKVNTKGGSTKTYINASGQRESKPAISKQNLTYLKSAGYKPKERKPAPVFVTDYLFRAYSNGSERSTPKYDHPINFTKLVPVLVQANNTDQDEVLLWFEPTKPFFRSLSPVLAAEAKHLIRARNGEELKKLKAIGSTFKQPRQNHQLQITTLNKTPKRFSFPEPDSATTARIRNSSTVESLLIYPNPATAVLNFEITFEDLAAVKIDVTQNGELVKTLRSFKPVTERTNSFSFPVSGMAPGLYMVLVESRNGKRYMGKVLIQKP